jgi:hypothetical protein
MGALGATLLKSEVQAEASILSGSETFVPALRVALMVFVTLFCSERLESIAVGPSVYPASGPKLVDSSCTTKPS